MRPFYIPQKRLTIDLDKVVAVGDLQGSGKCHLFQIYMAGDVVTVESWEGDLSSLHESLMDKWLGRDQFLK